MPYPLGSHPPRKEYGVIQEKTSYPIEGTWDQSVSDIISPGTTKAAVHILLECFLVISMSFPESHNCFTDSVSLMVKTHHYLCSHSQNLVCSDFFSFLNLISETTGCFKSHVICLRLLCQVCHSQTWFTVISVIPNLICGSDSYLVSFKKAEEVFFHSVPKHIFWLFFFSG